MASGVIQYESQKHDFGEPTTLTLNTPYTVLTNGYLVVAGPYTKLNYSTELYTRCYINDQIVITTAYALEGVSATQSIPVIKDMVITVTHLPPSTTGGSVRFYPLI